MKVYTTHTRRCSGIYSSKLLFQLDKLQTSVRRVYMIGNPLVSQDSLPLKILPRLRQRFPEIDFVEIDPTEEFIPEKNSIIIDTVLGIDKVTWFNSLENFSAPKTVSPHDYDLGFHLRMLRKLGKLDKIRILGIPSDKINRKLLDKIIQEISMVTNELFSEEEIRRNCPHCDPNSSALKRLLLETEYFRVVCDMHPLVEGHVLIIPKEHLVAVGEYPDSVFQEFVQLYERLSKFIRQTYGVISTFEHGKIGQTVFHSHVHLLPFSGSVVDIIPEGNNYVTAIKSLDKLRTIFQSQQKYLFFSIENKKYLVDTTLGAPRFFRDRFAKALGHPERGNWKQMHDNMKVMKAVEQEIERLESKWGRYN